MEKKLTTFDKLKKYEEFYVGNTLYIKLSLKEAMSSSGVKYNMVGNQRVEVEDDLEEKS